MNIKEQPKVFAIVVTYNGEKWIEQCIKSLTNSDYPTHIIVVDNNSNDNTVNLIKSYDLHLMEESENHGFGIANNLGISFALKNNADYIFLLNQDAFIQKNTISTLVNVAETEQSYGLYSPIHLNESGNDFDSNFLKNYVIDSASQYLADSCIRGKTKATYPIYSINAAAWFIRRKTFKVAGGFDPIFFMYGEDNDYSHRLEFYGIKRAIVPNSFIHHSRGRNSTGKIGLWTTITTRAKRIHANTLAKIKNPNKNFINNALYCFMALFFAAINELFYHLSFKEFMAHILAIAYLTRQTKQIIKHLHICKKTKSAWLKN